MKEIHASLEAYPNVEIVITDDGSTDDTVQEALEAAKECGCDLQVVSHEQSCGQSTAVLTAVKHAKGEWIVTSDADGQNDPSDMPKMLELAAKVSNPNFASRVIERKGWIQLGLGFNRRWRTKCAMHY